MDPMRRNVNFWKKIYELLKFLPWNKRSKIMKKKRFLSCHIKFTGIIVEIIQKNIWIYVLINLK